MFAGCSNSGGNTGDNGTDRFEDVRQDVVQDVADPGIQDIRGEDVTVRELPLDLFEEVQPECTVDADCKDTQHSLCETVYCDTAAGKCKTKALTDYIACDDGDLCTLHDYCLSGQCSPGVAMSCDDGNPCTDNSCDPQKGCQSTNVADDTGCDDNNAFTQNDVCKAGVCVGEGTLTCQNDSDCSWVDSENKCLGRMICNQDSGKCVLSPKTVIHCLQDPANQCKVNTCDPKTGECVMRDKADDTSCEDGLLCTVGDKCMGGKCVSGDDKCTASCTSDEDCKAFDDGNACNGAPTCNNGVCAVGQDVTCDQAGDGTCGMSVCDPETGKCKDLIIPDGNSCVTNLCKDGQVCNQGACVGGTDIICDDQDPCTTDSCDPEKGCQTTAIDGCKNCSDATQCDDSNQCTLDECVGGACQWTPQNQIACDDKDPCTENDKCNDKGDCLAGTPKDCDDQNPCTTDSCDSDTGDCVNTPIEGCENCENTIDDNNNGWTDCDDPYCKDNAACQNIKLGDTCANPFLVNNGDPITLTGLGDNPEIDLTGDTTNFTDDYQGTCNTMGHESVQDSVYKMVLGESMHVKVSMDFSGDNQTSPWAVTYVYKDVCGAGNLTGCAAGKENAAVIDQSFDAGTYYIVVDGEWTVDLGPYTLSLVFSAPPATETDCNNKVDDDLDGKLDCLDDDCSGSPNCLPCDTRADLVCGQDLVEPLSRNNNSPMYKFVAAFDGAVTLTLTPTNASDAFAIAVYEDIQQGCDDIKEVKTGAIGDDLTFDSTADTTYIVKVTPAQDGGPAYTLGVACLADHEVNCNNGIDEDKNGLTDCEDPACFKDNICTGGHSGEDCTDPLPINDGNGIGLAENGKTFTYFNTTKGAKTDLTGSCAADSATAGDLVYKIVLDQQASVNFTVTPQGTFEPVLYIFKDSCDGEPATCVTFNNGTTEVQSDMDPGTYFVVVDGGSADTDKAEGTFKLDVKIANVTARELCANGVDDNGDNLIDCQDPECFTDDNCTGGHSGADCTDPFVVKPAGALAEGDSLNFWNSTSDASDSYAGSCGGTGSGDLLYTFTLDKPLEVTASVTFKGFGHPALYLYKDTCGSADAEAACDAATDQIATLDKNLTAGTYYLAVDGVGASDAGPYDLNISAKAAAPPEASCWNTKDDNNDQAVDCNDTTCSNEPICTATTCQAARTLQCGDTITIKNFDRDWTNAVSDFSCNSNGNNMYAGYPEYTAAFNATCDTPVTVTLTQNTANMNVVYDLYLLDGSTTCDASNCQQSAMMDSYGANLNFNATKGQKFFITAAMAGLYTDITTATEDELTLTVNCDCMPLPKAGDVVITEVMNNPAGSDTGKEYFEVYNPTDKAIDLEGCKIQGKDGEAEINIAGTDDGLHDTTIPSMGYIVFGSGDVVGHILPENTSVYSYTGTKYYLANSSDVIKVVCNDVVLDEVDYSGSSSGHSLNLSPAHYNAVDNDNMDNWCYTYEDPSNLIASNDTANFPYNDNGDNYGTPGAQNPTCNPAPKAGEALINEVMVDPNGGAGNVYVEVKNTTGHQINLDGCTISPNTTNDLALSGTADNSVIVPANGYIVFGNSDAVKTSLHSGAAFYNLDGSLVLDKVSDSFDLTCDNTTIDSISYDTNNGWTVKTGASMFLKSGNDATTNDDAANWCTSFTAITGTENKGTPGADNGECPKSAEAGDVIITELMVDPASVDTDKQYIEFYNTLDSPIDLDSCTVTSGSGTFALTDFVLPGNNYLVVGVNAHVAGSVASGATSVNANGAFGLDLSQDTVKLTCGGTDIDTVAYDTGSNWTITEGKALNLDPDHYNATDNDDPANWCASKTEITGDYSNDDDGSGGILPNYGTPGALNTTCAAGSMPPAEGEVVITELMPNPNSSDTNREYFEVYNTTGHPISLLNCQIKSKSGSSTKAFTIEPADDGLHDTQIEANGYFVFGQSDTVQKALPTDTPFYQYGTAISLTNSSDWVELNCGDTTIDHVAYSSSSSGHSNSLDIDHYNATDNDDAAHWCFTPDTSPIDAAYNTDSKPNYGTPGAQNPSCP